MTILAEPTEVHAWDRGFLWRCVANHGGLRSAQPELHQRHQCSARERRLGVVIRSDLKQWERVSHENIEHRLCGLRTRCPCWVVKDVLTKNWEDLCEEDLSPLTKKCWQLLPSVVRMHRRHSGYLFFDERGRIYRLRDEEIILWKDVALLSNVGWPRSVCLWLELPWPNVWWFFLHVLPTFGTYWCHMRRVYASSRRCAWAACVSTNWINWKVICLRVRKKKLQLQRRKK